MRKNETEQRADFESRQDINKPIQILKLTLISVKKYRDFFRIPPENFAKGVPNIPGTLIPRKSAVPNSRFLLFSGCKVPNSLLLLKEGPQFAVSKFAVPKFLVPKTARLEGLVFIDMVTEMVIDGYVLVWEKHLKKQTRLGNWKFIEDSTQKNSNNNSYTRLASNFEFYHSSSIAQGKLEFFL